MAKHSELWHQREDIRKKGLWWWELGQIDVEGEDPEGLAAPGREELGQIDMETEEPEGPQETGLHRAASFGVQLLRDILAEHTNPRIAGLSEEENQQLRSFYRAWLLRTLSVDHIVL